jgi:hypothetical protein
MTAANPDHRFATDVLNASVAIMSILVAVIAVVAVEYKKVRSYPPLADPIYGCVFVATAAAVFSGFIAFLSLLHLRVNIVHARILAWFFGILIIWMVLGIVWVVWTLVA